MIKQAALILALAGLAGCDDDRDTTYDGRGSTATPPAQQVDRGQLAAADRDFILAAASSGLFEVRSSELAAKNAATPQMKELAGRMSKDHSAVNASLKALAARKGVELPSDLQQQHKDLLGSLETQDKEAFDRAYHDAQVKAHVEAIALFENASKNAADPDVKKFAADTLPALKEHLQHLHQGQYHP